MFVPPFMRRQAQIMTEGQIMRPAERQSRAAGANHWMIWLRHDLTPLLRRHDLRLEAHGKFLQNTP
jgi:hypothetical protein